MKYGVMDALVHPVNPRVLKFTGREQPFALPVLRIFMDSDLVTGTIVSAVSPASDTRKSTGLRQHFQIFKKFQKGFFTLSLQGIGNNVKEKFLADIKKAKYFGILFDSIPDISHTDQMSEKYMQTEGISLETCTVKLNGFKLFLRGQRNEIVERAIQYATTQCEEMGISMETRGRIRRKKMMPAEMARDAGLTMQEEMRRSMFEWLYRFSLELDARSEAMDNILLIFAAIQRSYLLSAKEEQLQGSISNSSMTKIFNEISDEDVTVEIMRLCRHMEAAKITPEEANKWTVLQFLKFIVKWDFCETLPNLSLCLRFFLTICVSVASCERSFSKQKLIKNYLRSSMTQARLNSLTMISIENECAKTVNFDEIIGKFAEAKSRTMRLKN
ncbi:uncharacterized protein LOC121858193 [Homarus americanus]|uniref:uncharacterized protein LOC121858193 n=1 Tax=Homarus americanus TaxID=6706 RepID=UPI001C46BA45|nr:uncharacterized protein LOC121858193 [Homarus americanus]